MPITKYEDAYIQFNDQLIGMSNTSLLSNTFNFHVQASNDLEGELFSVLSSEYSMKLSVLQGTVKFERNQYEASIHIGSNAKYFFITLSYDPTKFHLSIHSVLNNGENIEQVKTIDTSTLYIPINLIRWAQRHNLLPKKNYSTSLEFLTTLLEDIRLSEKKIRDTNSHILFWDRQRKQGLKNKLLPKLEPEAATGIYAFLQDSSINHGYELMHETSSSSGSVDLYVIATNTNGGFIKICIEIKNAHSDDIEHGLKEQLPEYIRGKNADYGIYLVLSYKCEKFERPLEELSNLKLKLTRLNQFSNISVEIFDLSIPLPPSSKKFVYQ